MKIMGYITHVKTHTYTLKGNSLHRDYLIRTNGGGVLDSFYTYR